MAVTVNDRPCVDPLALKTACDAAEVPTDAWWGRANTFTLTRGEEPGSGSVLLRKSDLDALDLTAYLTLTFIGSDTSHQRKFTNITLLGAECVTPGAPDDPSAVYLCELADQRHQFRKTPFANGYKAFNVRTADGSGYQTDTLTGGVAWTWQQVVTNLAGLVGPALGTLTLPFSPHGPPENLVYSGTAWAALNDVLDRLACTVAFTTDTGVYTVVRLGSDGDATLTALEKSEDFLGRTWDGYGSEPNRAWRPEKVRVKFVRRPTPDFGAGQPPYYTVDVTLAATTGVVTGTVVELHDDLTALAQTGAPSNAAALTTRANERAADWLRKRGTGDRPLLRAWRDIQPKAADTVGRAATSATWDDRGGPMRTWVRTAAGDSLENWKPLGGNPPWWPFLTGSSVSAWKEPVKVATTTNGTLAGAYANGALIDNIFIATGDRILIKNQSTASENGIYTVNASGAPTRATDADTGAELLGATVHVMQGITNSDTNWQCTTNATITVGTTGLTFAPVATGGVGTTDNALVRADGTSSGRVQGSSATLSDTGVLTTNELFAANVTVSNYLQYTDLTSGSVIYQKWGFFAYPGTGQPTVGFNCNNAAGIFFDGTYAAGRVCVLGALEVGFGEGVILASPNGTRWRITVNNSGTLVVTSI